MSSECRNSWLHAVCLAEGTKRKHGEWRIAQNSGPLCEAIKLAGFLCGYDIRTTKVIMKYNGKQHEQITLRTRPYVTGQRIVKTPLGEQLVWCVTTNNRTVVIKQGDTISISGNTFKPLYGGESGTKAEQAYYRAFKLKLYGITGAQEKWIATVVMEKKLTVGTGLTFYWPETAVSRTGYVNTKRSICNYPVQYLATGEIIPIAVTHLWHRMHAANLRSFLVNTVHDSAITEQHPEEISIMNELSEVSFVKDTVRYLNVVYGINFDVPLEVESKTTTHWGKY